jgi:hypothetical protein
MTPRNRYFAPQPRLGDQEVIDVGYIQKQRGKDRARYCDPPRADDVDHLSIARPTPSGSLAEMETDKAHSDRYRGLIYPAVVSEGSPHAP